MAIFSNNICANGIGYIIQKRNSQGINMVIVIGDLFFGSIDSR